MIEDRSEWTDLDHEIEADWFASLDPWQFVAHLAQSDRAVAAEYARDAWGCDTIEIEGQRIKVRRDGQLWFTPDGVNVPVEGPIGSVFVATPRMVTR